MEKPNKAFNWIIKHRKITTFSLVIFSILIIALPSILCNTPDRAERLEIIYFSSQITAAFFVIVGTIVAVWQYYLSSSQKMHEKDFERVEKAIELANYYKDNILSKYSFVKSIFDECGITELIEYKRDRLEIKDFDSNELKKLYKPDEIKQFEQLSTNKKFIDAIIRLNNVFDMGLNGVVSSEICEGENGKKITKTAVDLDGIVSDFFGKYIYRILNDAEYFAMSFTHNIADESVIYQSIYPTYLEMCFVMYYFISVNSDPVVAKLYTNIAHLYNEWRQKEQKQKEEIANRTRDAGTSVGTVYKKSQ